MEESLGISFNAKGHITTKSEYALTRYADDFVVFAKSKESCLQAKLKIQSWLAIRGLELSETKTKILHIEEGFNFLGFNIRHYKTKSKKKGVTFLCKPSKESVKSFKKRITLEWKKGSSWTTERIIANLNSKLIGWGNYFNSGVSGKTFNALDSWMWTKQLAFVKRRHPKKSMHWLKEKYWGKAKGRNDRWVFMDKNSDRFLHKLSWIPVRRHVIVKGRSSVDDPTLREYWHKRQAHSGNSLIKTRQIIWRKQKGLCLICKDNIDNGEDINVHHIKPKQYGGNHGINNLAMLHANCHRQLHSKHSSLITDVSKLLEPCAG